MPTSGSSVKLARRNFQRSASEKPFSRVIDVERNKLMVTRGKGIDKLEEIGTDIYTLLYIKHTTNRNPLYSTENSTQYLQRLYGKRMEKSEYMYMCN